MQMGSKTVYSKLLTDYKVKIRMLDMYHITGGKETIG